MAKSPAHVLGEAIGGVLEAAAKPLLAEFAQGHGLYLDHKGPRAARGRRQTVAWADRFGNSHDLDFVLERGGTDEQTGDPVAFIEVAWRRYTKHSRNKAQEIQAAVTPLAETYQHLAPFLGAVLAGVFTERSLDQLRSHGFALAYFPYDTVIHAFAEAGLDVRYGETTPTRELTRKANAWKKLTPRRQRRAAERVAAGLLEANRPSVEQLMRELEASVTRRVRAVVVLPLHGVPFEAASAAEGISFIREYVSHSGPRQLARYEVMVRYTNGDRIEGQFRTKAEAIRFLSSCDA